MGCMYSTSKLNKCTYNNTPTFNFKDISTKAKVLKVYDGDTIWVAMYYQKNPIKIKVRLNGIDTPEIRTKNLEEKEKGLLAKEYFKNLIGNKIVTLKCGNFDKYGRLLGDIYYLKQHVNNIMIEKGYAIKYDGGIKK